MAGRFAPRPRSALRVRATAEPGVRRRWTAPGGPYDLGLVVGPLRRGPADPTFRQTPDGAVWRASRTPEGPATIRLVQCADGAGEAVEAEAWGPGADWLLGQLPHLLGESDDPAAFVPRHRAVLAAGRSRPGLRLCRTGLVLESLIPSVLEQKVTTVGANRSWRSLVQKYGEPAPGPVEGLHVMPEPRTWARIPSWEWHRANVEEKRSSTILRAVRVARRLEEAAAMEPRAALERLSLIAGIGPWTAAEVVQRTNGAADAVTVGDLHLPGIVGHVLAGERDADDARMLELLAPYEGQRHRAVRLILLSGRMPARRAPRMPVGDISSW